LGWGRLWYATIYKKRNDANKCDLFQETNHFNSNILLIFPPKLLLR
jgi:hypothetical protein